MKYPRLSAIFVAAVSAASLLMASTASFAAHKKHEPVVQENFKGEANFKAEVPPPCPPILLLHDGFYIGAGVGYDAYKNNWSNELSFNTGFFQSASWNTTATGWMGGLFAGYGLYFDWFYAGAEINVSTSAATGSFNYFNTSIPGGVLFNTNWQARASYGIALLPGIKINDSTLFYVRLGYLRSDFKWSVNSINGIQPFTYSTSNWKNGFNYGVGLESYVAECVSVRGEYTHTAYNSNTKTVAAVNSTTGLSLLDTSKVDLSNNEFMLSLIYHFGF